MKKIIFALTAVFFLTTVSCKKKKDEAPAPIDTTPVANNYDGLLSSVEMASVFSGSIAFTSGITQGIFPTQGFMTNSFYSDGFNGTAVNVGTVSVNSVSLKAENQSGNIIYNDTTSTMHNSPFTWSVSGANGIPAFTYTYTATRPTYTGWNTLQDTIKISQTTTINLTGINGADEITVYVIGNSGMASRVLSGTATSVVFAPSQLSSIGATSSASIWISCNKYSIVTLGGKNFKFKTGYSIYKSIVTQ